MTEPGYLLRDREAARLELERVTRERDEAREQRDAAIDREALALLRVEQLEVDLRAAKRVVSS